MFKNVFYTKTEAVNKNFNYYGGASHLYRKNPQLFQNINNLKKDENYIFFNVTKVNFVKINNFNQKVEVCVDYNNYLLFQKLDLNLIFEEKNGYFLLNLTIVNYQTLLNSSLEFNQLISTLNFINI